ncbi:MAG: sigma-70 family RNA polymerase sigma factor [Sedimentisphaerales bacterium]|nr:sigma-70 family RNA polymerase sigma factor [Sedimentisphaerales bacterium]
MAKSDRTQLGGPRSRFQTTQWLEIRALADLDEAQRKEALNALIGRYWKPVYCYLRRKGHDNENAKDLTQSFFQDIVLGRHLVERADETQGRFRTFLLTALDRYVVSVHRRQMAAKRRPADGTISLDETQEAVLAAAAKDLRPDEAFTYAWAVQLLEEVLAESHQQCVHDGKEVHWELFRARVLHPIITGREPESLSELCERFGIATAVKAENMIVTVRRRFQAAMKNRVRDYVSCDEEVEQEIRDLMAILSR